ncbi:hypothetical protein HF82_01060 [Limosilactobacillus reuteri]|nr:hypothetical protein HF82_01060 [Limosilactobacillus reuteri]
MHDFTSWIDNKLSTYLFIGYLILVIIIYVLGIIINSYIDYKKYLESEENRNGLISQFNLDKEEKQNLQRNIELKEMFINTILSTLDEDKVSEVQNKFKLLEEMHNIERKNENSKNN